MTVSKAADVLDHHDVKDIFNGHAIAKGGFGQRLLSRFAALFVRYFYEPSVIRWLLKFNYPFKGWVAIIGGGFAGCELGVTLAGRGKKISIIEESKRIGSDVGMVHRWVWMKQLRDSGAKLVTEAKVVEITEKGVVISKAGSTQLIEADTIVLATGLKPNNKLAAQFSGKAPVTYLVGDCTEPGKLLEATASGFLVGQKI
jgi:2,4-dienoyl-CoA reductase (NADPH2)